MTEVEEKNAKETDKVESALQRAIHITKLLIIWAARSFLYSGCTFCVFLVFHFVYGKAFSIAVAPYVLQIVGGEQYVAATSLFRALVPVLIFSFPGIVLGWPTLGALDKAAQVTKTTILSAVVQVASLLLLIATGHFTVMWIAIFRCVTEFVLMASRGCYCWKYRSEFC